MTQKKDIIKEIEETKRSLGEIYPVIKAKDGTVLDGRHRLLAGWTSEKIMPEVTTDLQKLVVRYVANRRRKISNEEKTEIFDGIAEILIKENVVEVDMNTSVQPHLKNRPDVIPQVAKLLGSDRTTINKHISDKYKRGYALYKITSEQRKKDKIRRGRFAVQGELLHIIDENSLIIITHLMHKSNTAWHPLMKNLDFLIERGYILDFGRVFELTDDGRLVSSIYKVLRYYLQEKEKLSKELNLIEEMEKWIKNRKVVIKNYIKPSMKILAS